MNKYLYLLIVSTILVCSSCSRFQMEDQIAEGDIYMTKASSLSKEFQVAEEDLMMYIDCFSTHRKGERKVIKDICRYCYESECPSFYFVNYCGGGYDIVSADKRMQPLFSKSDEGHISEEELNPGLKIWLDFNAERMQSVNVDAELSEDMAANLELWNNITGTITTKAGAIRPYYVYSTENVDTLTFRGPLLQTKWGQMGNEIDESYWNTYCQLDFSCDHHCPAGCGPVAAGQILYYLHTTRNLDVPMPAAAVCHGSLPTSFSGARSTGYISSMPIDYYETDSSKIDHAAIFLSYIGYLAGAEYYGDVTVTSIGTVVESVFQQTYQLGGMISSYDAQSIYLSISNDNPLYVRGQSETSGIGHAWVIDGVYRLHRYGVDHYCLPDHPLSEEEIESLTPDDCNFDRQFDFVEQACHMNWGDDGLLNGWFSILPSGWTYDVISFDCSVYFYWNY